MYYSLIMLKNFFLLIILYFCTMINANAYIDPGTVSILLQGLIGALAATIVTLKIYWYKISKFFNIRKKVNIDQENKNKDIK